MINHTICSQQGNNSCATNLTFPVSDSNTTDSSAANWSFMTVFNLVTLILGLMGNGGILLPFMRDRSLRTPFNIYLINLLIANIASIILRYPLIIYTSLYSFRWSLGYATCTFSLYGSFVIAAVAENAHLLIGVNRLWAVMFPMSYRSHHSVKTAVFLCVGMWLYVHLTTLPAWLMDAIYYRRPVEIYGCFLNTEAQAIYNKVTEVVIWMPPPVGLLATSVIIQLTRLIRRRRPANPRNIVLPIDVNTVPTSVQLQPATSNRKTLAQSEPSQNRVPNSRQKSHGHLVLMLLTMSTTICWLPMFIYFFLLTFEGIHLPNVCFQLFTILASCQHMLDPLLFTFALKSLRDSLRRFILRS
jgi:cysteinyl leukotriene receptor 1